jgi:hypothetical protein
LSTENELQTKTPWFFEKRLLPSREKLAKRKSIRSRHWWELSEPRPTWMDSEVPRLISPSFGHFGSFALDPGQSFVVVQGNAWTWKADSTDYEIVLAYLALLNSYEFEALLELKCPRVGGGQYQLYARDLSSVPLPDLRALSPALQKTLISIGNAIVEGSGLDPFVCGDAVANAYGMTREEFQAAFARGEIGELQEVFDSLAKRWKNESKHMSKISSMERLESHGAIVRLGDKAVPLILRELRRDPYHWFGALSSITRADPVAKEHRGRLKLSTNDWLDWGRQNRQL